MHGAAGRVREAPCGPEGFQRSLFRLPEAEALARFLNAHGQERVTAQELIEQSRSPERIGTFLLRHQGDIVACAVVDERDAGGFRVAVVTRIIVWPERLREEVVWSELVLPLVRALSWGTYRRIELDAARLHL